MFLTNLVRRGMGSGRAGVVRPSPTQELTPVLAGLWRPGPPQHEPFARSPQPPPGDPRESAVSEAIGTKAPASGHVPAEATLPPSVPFSRPDPAVEVAPPLQARRTERVSPPGPRPLPQDAPAAEGSEERTNHTPDTDTTRSPIKGEETIAPVPMLAQPRDGSIPERRGIVDPEHLRGQHDPRADSDVRLPALRPSPQQHVPEPDAPGAQETALRQTGLFGQKGEFSGHPVLPESEERVLVDVPPQPASRTQPAPLDGVVGNAQQVRHPPADPQPAPRPVAGQAAIPVRTRVATTRRPRSYEPTTAQPESGPIQVRIGTVEVRASTPPAASRQTPEPQGFDAYAAMRTYTGWEGA